MTTATLPKTWAEDKDERREREERRRRAALEALEDTVQEVLNCNEKEWQSKAHAKIISDLSEYLLDGTLTHRQARAYLVNHIWSPEDDPAELPQDDLDYAEALRATVDSALARAIHDPPRSIGDVFRGWQTSGPVLHEPTGIEELDELTRGGPAYASDRPWIVAAPPDDAKTLVVAADIADTYVRRGVSVGIVAADETDDDLVTRLMQRQNWSRDDCDRREPSDIARMQKESGGLPLEFYRKDWPIELAAADIVCSARLSGRDRAALFIDSLHTCTCLAERDRDLAIRDAITARCSAIRDVLRKYRRLIVIATAEVSREFYGDNRRDARSAAAEARAIEYGAGVLLNLRMLRDDLLEVFVAKNKQGRKKVRFHLAVDLAAQRLSARKFDAEASRNASRNGNRNAAAQLALLIVDQPGLNATKLRIAARPLSNEDVDRAKKQLGDAVVIRKKGKAMLHFLDGSKVPESILASLSPEDRKRVVAARPPNA